MTGSLRTLLLQSLDFAGLFPPASLPMAQATAIFLQERNAQASGLLARFVCPVTKLNELAVSTPAGSPRMQVAAILRGGKTAGEFLANLEADLAGLAGLAAFPESRGNAFVADTLEVRIPADALTVITLRKVTAAIIALLARQPGKARQLYLEIAPSPALAEQLAQIAEAGEKLLETTGIALGYKLRTGGSDAASVPSVPHVSAALAAAHTHKLAMKCTGGLHYPLHGKHAGADHALHGFINLLAAAALAHNRQVPAETLEAVLAEEDATAFAFGPDSLRWRDLTLTATELASARNQLLGSFGSCYADIPQAELRRLGWRQ
jgi:hypothetical protein